MLLRIIWRSAIPGAFVHDDPTLVVQARVKKVGLGVILG